MEIQEGLVLQDPQDQLEGSVPTAHQDFQGYTGRTVTQATLVLLGLLAQVAPLVTQGQLDRPALLEVLGQLAFQVTLVHRGRWAQLEYQEVLEILALLGQLDRLAH